MGLVAGAAIGAVGAIGASAISKSATNKAVDAQTANSQQQLGLQSDIYNQNKTTLAPYVNAGLPATGAINSMLGLSDPQQGQDAFRQYIQNSDYGYQLGEGSNALNSNYAGAGTLKSGAAMKGIEAYRQNLQSGYRNNFMAGLGNQQALGMSAASAQAGVGQNYANSMANIGQGQADAIGAGAAINGQTNANLVNSLVGIGSGLFNPAQNALAPNTGYGSATSGISVGNNNYGLKY